MTITELAMYNALRSLEQNIQAIEPENCVWTECRGGTWEEDIYWDTSCKQAYVIIEGTLSENHYNFCPNCGKRIKEIPLSQEVEDD